MAINRATYLEESEDRAVQAIATDRKWSISQTIAEMVREAPTFQKALRRVDRRKAAEPSKA